MTLLAIIDPTAIAREARRLRRQLQGDLVNGVAGEMARGLAGLPDRRIEQLMGTPLRRVVLDALFWGAPQVLDRTPTADVVSSLRCDVTGAADGGYDVYWLEFSAGAWQSGRGTPPSPAQITLTVEDAELLRLACGRSSPVQAFLAGKLRASGNPVLAARLTALARALLGPRPQSRVA
jgi:hypothetical protein